MPYDTRRVDTPRRDEAPDPPCPFCFVPKDRTAFEDELTRALWDSFPVSPGHLLIVPRRHIPTWFDASQQERVALMKALDRARDLLADRHHPDGYNIGLNVGKAAGQIVFHLHLHLIPRYEGDVPDPRGGVRHVIPGKGNYLSQEPGGEQKSRLVKGGEHDPLLPYLSEELTRAQRADIAVGFAMRSGVVRMEEHLRDFLDRGGRLRLLTGDYLGITDPDALTRLLDRVSPGPVPPRPCPSTPRPTSSTVRTTPAPPSSAAPTCPSRRSNRPEYRRTLFVAHREEILHQSRRTFRAIRPEAKLGSYDGQGRDPHADVLFASIQTPGRTAHLERFDDCNPVPFPDPLRLGLE
jgi:diadenosine tetraphosphate (Ap4A) HIT family hydrolase